MDHITWTDVVLHDWTDYSGEFGHRSSHVRRVRLTPSRSARYTIEGLIRVDAYGPEADWTDYQWEEFDYYRPVTRHHFNGWACNAADCTLSHRVRSEGA